MSGAAEIDDVYSVFEETARLLEAPCSRDTVVPILTAYGDPISEVGIHFNVTTGAGRTGELDFTFTVPPTIDDPYAHALANGLVEATDHPVGSLLSDFRERCAVNEYLVDCGVVGGFRKVYVHFPRELQSASELADIPSMPRAVAENAGFFARHGLDNVAMLGIDYQNKTLNLYFQLSPESPLEPKTILAMLREAGLPEPNEGMLDFARKAFRVNVTLGWDTSEIVRIALAQAPARGLDPSVLSAPIEPKFERFLRNTPYTYAGERVNLLGAKWTRKGEVLEFASYHSLSPMQRKMWMAIHKEEI
ncbi:aromatic prenyltransferase [Streptomyces sp. SBT349]|uniref:aromatic prenyltransferase n=1 Tax=Streptomyces sp. SBT349 TaxID=1580539 RepID=UPI00099B4E2B|nr:aromatic prenyltransferase [Streptomyces sp. SBT349]